MKRNLLLGFAFLVIAIFNGSIAQAQWKELGTSNSNQLLQKGKLSIVTDSKGNIYADAVQFNTTGKAICYVAKWNGKSWSALGDVNSSSFNNMISVIAIDGKGNLYAAGTFTNAKGNEYIAKWNGSTWTEVGGSNSSTFNSHINTITFDNTGNLYAAGYFKNGIGKYYVAKWNGAIWSELGGNNTSVFDDAINVVYADLIGNIYIGGNFKTQFSDYDGTCCFAKWDGKKWTNPRKPPTEIKDNEGNIIRLSYSGEYTGPYKNISTIISDKKGNIYIAGALQNVKGSFIVAKWDGKVWTELGGDNSSNFEHNIYSLAIDANDNVFAVGGATKKFGKEYYFLSKWDGKKWSIVEDSNGFSFNNYIRAIAIEKNGNIYIGGGFKNENDCSFIAKFEATRP